MFSSGSRADVTTAAATSVEGVVTEAMKLIQSASPTWKSAVGKNILIFVLGSPLLVTGLSGSGIAAAFLLGTLTWRAYGSAGFLLVAAYFVIITPPEAAVCVLASQIANLGESIIGAAFQDKEGFKWRCDVLDALLKCSTPERASDL